MPFETDAFFPLCAQDHSGPLGLDHSLGHPSSLGVRYKYHSTEDSVILAWYVANLLPFYSCCAIILTSFCVATSAAW
jgi:hypothetical protein